MNVPPRGRVIAVATAIQESSLINLPNLGDANNADSLGLFQQRPSQGGAPRRRSWTPSTPAPSSTPTSSWYPAGRPCPSPRPRKPYSAAPPPTPTPGGNPTPPRWSRL
jgi:hypothetical protein